MKLILTIFATLFCCSAFAASKEHQRLQDQCDHASDPQVRQVACMQLRLASSLEKAQQATNQKQRDLAFEKSHQASQ